MYFMARGGSPLEDLHQVVGDGEDFGLTIVTAYPTLLGGKGGHYDDIINFSLLTLTLQAGRP